MDTFIKHYIGGTIMIVARPIVSTCLLFQGSVSVKIENFGFSVLLAYFVAAERARVTQQTACMCVL
jgi:hypothetical protein